MNESMGPKTVYLVDDDPEVCHSLAVLLDNEGYRTAEIPSAEILLDTIDTSRYGVIVVDYCLGGISGLELQEELADRGINWPVIFISGQGDIKTSVTALKRGAIDFLEKPFNCQQLLTSVKEAFQRLESVLKLRVHRDVVESRCRKLTQREREVMEYVVGGVSNRDLAKHLGVSTRTVEAHRSRMMKKMAADSLPDLVCMVDLCTVCKSAKLPQSLSSPPSRPARIHRADDIPLPGNVKASQA